LDNLLIAEAKRVGNDLGCFDSTNKRACEQEIDLDAELAQAASRVSHAVSALGGQRALLVSEVVLQTELLSYAVPYEIEFHR
jgi:hypothetical protein